MKSIIVLLAVAGIGWGQQAITFSAPAPSGVVNTSAQVVGNRGNSTYYYWVIPRFPIGLGANPVFAQVINAPTQLTGTNYVQVSWTPVPNAINYDVLRTTGPTIPSPCTCLIRSATTVVSFADNTSAPSVYTYTPANPATGTIYLDNTTGPAPAITTSAINPATGTQSTVDSNGNLGVNGYLMVGNSNPLSLPPLGGFLPGEIWAGSNLTNIPAAGTGAINATSYTGITTNPSMTYNDGNPFRSVFGASIFPTVVGNTGMQELGGTFTGPTWNSSGTTVTLSALDIGPTLQQGTATSMLGIDVTTSITGGSTTNVAGISIQPTNLSGGTIANNNYGLQLYDQSNVTVTGKSYNLYSTGEKANNHLDGRIETSGILTVGTKFTVTGCSPTATLGGATAGSFHSGSTATCTFVITMGGATGFTAPNGWACSGNDINAGTSLHQNATTTTTASITGAVTSGDVINFACQAY